MLSKRELFIKSIFIPNQKKDGFEYLSDKEAEDIVKKISQVGETIGYIGTNLSKDEVKNNQRKHKYDVWIAKEVKKNIEILNRIVDLI
jgi:hypothetical protein